MTAQRPLPLVPHSGPVLIGDAAALIEDVDGGRVFVHGELVMAWEAGDTACRRWAAVQLVRIKAARAVAVAAGFGIDTDTLRRWGQAMTAVGAAGLVPAKRGPKGPSVLTPQVIADIRSRRGRGETLAVVAAAVGVSTDSVRRATGANTAKNNPPNNSHDQRGSDATASEPGSEPGTAEVLPVLPVPAARRGERAAARAGLLQEALPVFAPAARVPLAGLLLAMPALEATGLLSCARSVFGALANGFYGLDTMLVEGVLRALAGQPRAEGATRIDPTALGRVLGLDRAPEVKTIRRKITALASTGKAQDLLAAMAATHLTRTDTGIAGTGDTESPDPDPDPDPDTDEAGGPLLVLYVDGHVRAYQGARTIGKTHLARLRFPAPATVETWVSDAAGDPVLVVMATPGASLAGELRALLPTLRAAVGDDRRVLVGFDRGGWSPALFAHMAAHGFDVLTWRKGPTPDIDPAEFTDRTYRDETGREHTWRAADTTVTLPVTTTPEPGHDTSGQDSAINDTSDHDSAGRGGDRREFSLRQVTLAVPATKHKKRATSQGQDDGAMALRQIHILTTRTDLPAEEVIYRMGSRWRQENYFRYARMHFDLDSHDAYTATDDDPSRLVPNPARKHTYQAVLAARARHEQATAATDAALLAAKSPTPGTPTLLTNTVHDALTADLRAAEHALQAAEASHATMPSRVPLAQVSPGQQVLDVETKLITHAIRIAAFNTATTLARDLRLHTGYARANHEAHTLIRQALTCSGDLHPNEGTLTVRLDPLPTRRATTAIKQLCQHLNATNTRYPGTELTLRYEIKTSL